VKGIRHIGIVVSDLERALHFYRDLLGFKESRIMDESGDFIEKITGMNGIDVTTVKLSADDGNLIELLHFKSPAAVKDDGNVFNRIGCTHAAFSTGDIEKDYTRLKKEGVQFICEPQLSSDKKAKVVFLKDPDGTMLELVQWLADSGEKK